MRVKSKMILICVMAVVFAFAASAGWAVNTMCTLIPANCTPIDAKVAVASNFYGPAQDLVAGFEETGQPGYGKCIAVCQNSTGHLSAEIITGTALPTSVFPTDPGFPRYDIFFAANTTAPQTVADELYTRESINNAKFQYAIGVPVLIAPYSLGGISDVSQLIVNQTTNTITADTTTNPSISSYALSTADVSLTALANPSAAPYGNAGFVILNDMGELTYPPVPSPLPNWMYQTLFGNIDDTYTNIVNPGATGIKAGFVSKAQICSHLDDDTYVWVQFTSTAYTTDILTQDAVLLSEADSTTPTTVAGKLRKYILDWISAGTWYSGFLESHCYLW